MEQNKNLAIIGASYLQLPLILKAKEMGFTTHVFAWKCGDVGESAADFFYPISIVEKDEILETCKRIGIVGVCSIASDLAMLTVNYVAQSLHLNSNDLETTIVSTNKHEMRLRFEKYGIPSPKSRLVDAATDLASLELDFPIIVKPTDRSGSRGICRLDNRSGLESAIQSAIDYSFEKKALVEEFAEGQEYSVEYISYHGKHTFLAMTLKKTTGAPHFIETGHVEPAPVSQETLSRVRQVVPQALDALSIREGASHTELKIDANGNFKIIEIGARMGGDCIGSDLVRLSTGLDFVRMVIEVAIGEPPTLTPLTSPIKAEIRFILNKDDYSEYLAFVRNNASRLIKTVYLDEKQLGKTIDSSTRAGAYIIQIP